MSDPETSTESRWRSRLLIIEFSALAVLVGAMLLLPRLGSEQQPITPAWLAIPALASLVVFLCFIALMYLRWVSAATPERASRLRWLFGLLALVLVSFWGYALLETWQSLQLQR